MKDCKPRTDTLRFSASRRGSMMLFVIIGVVALLFLALLIYVLKASQPSPQASTAWEQPVKEYLRLCTARATDGAVLRLFRGGGFMINESTLPEKFGPAKLLYYNLLVPVYASGGDYTIISVFDADPSTVRKLPDAPCYRDTTETGQAGSCTKKVFFKEMPRFPFGAGAVGEYRLRTLPHLALYKKDPSFPYEPHCSIDTPCDYSVQEQVEHYINDQLSACFLNATRIFDDRGITLTLPKNVTEEGFITTSIRDDGLSVALRPFVLKKDGETKMIDDVVYTNHKPLKQLFTLLHGGSTDYVLGVSGLLEQEARDPDFLIKRDGQDLLENTLFLNPDRFSISTSPFQQGTTNLSVVADGSVMSVLLLNRRPFLNQVVPAEIEQSATTTTFVSNTTTLQTLTPSQKNQVHIDVDYHLYLDAKDPDDATNAQGKLFRMLDDGLTISALDILDDQGGAVHLDPNFGSTFVYIPKTKKLGFRLIYTLGYNLTNELTYSVAGQAHQVSAPPGLLVLYIDHFTISTPLRLTIKDEQGNLDYITLYATADYQYGANITEKTVLYVNDERVPFDQAWPWLIIPNVDRGQRPDLLYFYEPDNVSEKCTINFKDLHKMNPDLIGTRFLPDKNLTHLSEYAPGIYRAIVQVIQDDGTEHFGFNRSFGFDQCCPSYTLMTKFRDRGICAPEICCFQAPFLGHEIRFFEKGAYNTTGGADVDPEDYECDLKTPYNQIGGDFYPQYLRGLFGQNVIMSFRENLDIGVGGEVQPTSNQGNSHGNNVDSNPTNPGVGEQTPRGVVQVLPLRFKPDLFDVRVSEDYNGPLEDYFQAGSALVQWTKDDPVNNWIFSWDNSSWALNTTVADEAKRLKQALAEDPNMFKENWTWWDYRERIKECDDGWLHRKIIRGDCVPEQIAKAFNDLKSFNLPNENSEPFKVLDPFICNDSDIGEWNGSLISINDFRKGKQYCPNLLETMRMIFARHNGTNRSCRPEDCCFEAPDGRAYWYMTSVNPKLFEQFGSWVKPYGLPGTALVIRPVGARPGHCSWGDDTPACEALHLCEDDDGNKLSPQDCPGTLHSFMNMTPTHLDQSSFDSGGPFNTFNPLSRITNFQWTQRVMWGPGTTTKPSGDTSPPGQGQIEYDSGVDSACSNKKILHRCRFGEGYGYDAQTFIDMGIDPKKIGLHPDGSRYCPDDLEVYKLMINGTCRIEDCCFEIAPSGWKTPIGRHGGANLGDWSLPCPLISAMEDVNDDIGTTNPSQPQTPSSYPQGHLNSGLSI